MLVIPTTYGKARLPPGDAGRRPALTSRRLLPIEPAETDLPTPHTRYYSQFDLASIGRTGMRSAGEVSARARRE
jgi:hypothetical protein